MNDDPSPLGLLHTLHVPAGAGPFPSVLALHGWGASAHDLLGLAPLFPGDVLMLCPQGRVRVPIGPGADGWGWFPLVPGEPPDARAFLDASRGLRFFVDAARERYPIDAKKTVPVGFSQGGIMAFDLALRQPERFAGLVGLSTWLPDVLAANLPTSQALEGFPVLVLHGKADEQIEIERARESRRHLEHLGVDLTYRELDMGHEINTEALRLVIGWLHGRLG